MKIIKQQEFEMQEQQDMILDACTPVTRDTSDLEEAFETYFVPTCREIGAFLGILDFRGGYENMMALNKYILEQDISTDEGKQNVLKAQTLAIRWQAANSLCNHEATKLGWKLPKWFLAMWEQHGNRPANEGEQQ